VTDGGPSSELPDDSSQHEELPERLRVHSLARVLGTTSRQVLDALTELDGRIRSAHSSVERVDALRVRDLLAGAPVVVAAPVVATEVAAAVEIEEPESRLLLETTVERPEYMPLFVAPQPVARKVKPDDSHVTDESQDTGDSHVNDDSGDTDDPAASDDSDDDDDDFDGDGDDGERGDPPANRRRRRGRRGRGRGRGEQNGSEADDSHVDAGKSDKADTGSADNATGNDDVDDDADDDGDDDNGSGDGATKRRRRRRRRKSGSGDDSDEGVSADDPPNTVVHERAPRAKAKSDSGNTEIQGIEGSTRLEAKRQRRRDGRDAGRRRPPVLTEAEFLARREAVERVMVVRDTVRTEPPHPGSRYTQIAVLEDGILVEHFVTSAASASLVGNIYLGIVQNVLPSMEAAFVDIGRGRNGVLYAGEVNWEAAGLGGSNRRIEQALRPGDYVVVQVSKDPVGHKGARLTTQLSLAGRYLVYVPGASSTGISRKLPDTERQRLKEILREVVPSDAGVIIRTASEGVKEDEIRADVNRLQERWTEIAERAQQTKEKAAGAALALYEEPDVLVKVIRDLFNEDFGQLIVSGEDAWETINEYVSSVAPELVSKLSKYEAAESSEGVAGPDIFAVHRIDEQLVKAMDRKVWLPSGGTLVIDRTEAMTVVDVNTGKFTGSGGNLEQTVTKNNIEAAEEVVRQLRLRDIGGMVVIDFIDMVLESNRDLVLRRLTEALGRDRTRHQVSEVTSLGLVQLTRKKLGTGLVEAFSTTCPHCSGRGIMLHADPVDSASSAPGRKSEPGGKSESGGRRGRRSKKGKVDEPAVVTLPAHAPGEHPMFRAMAAANGTPDDGDDDDESATTDEAVGDQDRDDAETEGQISQISGQVTTESTEEDVDDADFEDTEDEDTEDDDTDDDDADDDDTEDVDLDDDGDLEDDDLDDEEEDVDLDDEEDDDDEDGDTDDDVEDLDGDDSDSPAREFLVAASTGPPRRRRAAARPAGPPVRED
jgi:ribonuclease E